MGSTQGCRFAAHLGATRLVVTPDISKSVKFDLVDVSGYMLKSSVTNTDIRNLDAGTYYLRTYRVDTSNLTQPVDFTFSVSAPASGQTRAAFGQPDRDLIRGGDGNDILIGNSDIDRCMGILATICLLPIPPRSAVQRCLGQKSVIT